MSGSSDPVGDAVDRACRAARHIKRCEQIGSYAWHVWSRRKLFRVQTDAEWDFNIDELIYTFATCTCDAYYEDRTTICSHVIRVLQQIAEDAGEYDVGESDLSM
jgi:hypothetical protein